MEGCCERNFLKPSLNSTEFSLAMSEKIGSMFTYFHIYYHIYHHLQHSTTIIYCSFASVQCDSSASCVPSHLVSGELSRHVYVTSCIILHHLASSDISDIQIIQTQSIQVLDQCVCLSVQSFSYLLPIGRLFIIVLVTSVPKTGGYWIYFNLPEGKAWTNWASKSYYSAQTNRCMNICHALTLHLEHGQVMTNLWQTMKPYNAIASVPCISSPRYPPRISYISIQLFSLDWSLSFMLYLPVVRCRSLN